MSIGYITVNCRIPKIKNKERGKKRLTAKEKLLIANFSSATVEARSQLNNIFHIMRKIVNLKLYAIVRAKILHDKDLRGYHS